MISELEQKINALFCKHLSSVISYPITINPLDLTGSGRRFFRVIGKNGKSAIVMNYSGIKKEDYYYVRIAQFLETTGLNVPQLYYYEDKMVVLEDLGGEDLFSLFGDLSQQQIEKIYYQIIDQLVLLHGQGTRLYSQEPFEISAPFEYSLYRWETQYFMDNLIGNCFKINLEDELRNNLDKEFHLLAEKLAICENVLVHRDCQSKNIMIKINTPCFIDFQGMRFGLPQYDLVSLLEDPYIDLDSGLKDALINYYCKQSQSSITDKSQFMTIYQYCALQRLMQALGAYAYLGLKKDQKDYLQFIPAGVNHLRYIIGKVDGCSALKRLLDLIKQ